MKELKDKENRAAQCSVQQCLGKTQQKMMEIPRCCFHFKNKIRALGTPKSRQKLGWEFHKYLLNRHIAFFVLIYLYYHHYLVSCGLVVDSLHSKV